MTTLTSTFFKPRHQPARVLPGFNITLGFTLAYLSLIVLIPLSALVFKTLNLTWDQFWQAVTAPRVVASYKLTFGASFIAALVNAFFGMLLAWVLVRYQFFGKKVIDALVDLPFALPTAVAGISLTALLAGNGWVGQYLEPLGIQLAFNRNGVLIALIFIGLRKDLRRWLRRLHDDLDVTSIFVTHDQEEALEVADRVVLMNGGKVEQVGSPQQVWDNPANPFVYGFLGDVNLFKGRSAEGETHTYIRPHDLDVRRYSTGDTGIVARLERALVVGSVARLELVPHDESTTPEVIEAEIPANEFRDQHYVEGELLVLTPRKSQVFVSTHSSN